MTLSFETVSVTFRRSWGGHTRGSVCLLDRKPILTGMHQREKNNRWNYGSKAHGRLWVWAATHVMDNNIPNKACQRCAVTFLILLCKFAYYLSPVFSLFIWFLSFFSFFIYLSILLQAWAHFYAFFVGQCWRPVLSWSLPPRLGAPLQSRPNWVKWQRITCW